MGFYEVCNMASVYHHPEKHISVSCHVDDPLVLTKNAEGLTEELFSFGKSSQKVLKSKDSKLYQKQFRWISEHQDLTHVCWRHSRHSIGQPGQDRQLSGREGFVGLQFSKTVDC